MGFFSIPPIKSMNPTFSAFLSYTFFSREAPVELHPSGQLVRTLHPAVPEPKGLFLWEKNEHSIVIILVTARWRCPCCTDRRGIAGGYSHLNFWKKKIILWATRPARTLLKLSSQWKMANGSISLSPNSIGRLQKMHVRIFWCRALEGQWIDRRGKGRAGLCHRAGGTSLCKQVPLPGQAPSELTHLWGERDSFTHPPLPRCTRHLRTGSSASGSSPRAAPPEGTAGTRGQQPPAMGRSALAGCWPGGATQIVSVLKGWEGREQAVTRFSL